AANRFVAGAGTMAHDVGAAARPLHISLMYDGEPLPGGTKRGQGVHTAYEEDMLRQNAADMLARMSKEVRKRGSIVSVPTTGEQAAIQIVRLMQRTFDTIKPIDIVDAFAAGEELWPIFAPRTLKLIAH